jgi:hypothetical protein
VADKGIFTKLSFAPEAHGAVFLADVQMQPDRACHVLTPERIVYNHPQKGFRLIESDHLGEAGNTDANDQ